MSESQPLDTLRVDFQKACQVVHLLCEGIAVGRLTGLDKKTVLRILVTAGERCAAVLDEKVQDMKAENVQIQRRFT